MSFTDKRVPSRPVRIENALGEVVTPRGRFAVRIGNVTVLGLQVTAGMPVEKGDQVTVIVSNALPDGPPKGVTVSISLRGEVTWCKAMGDNHTWGVRFLYQDVREMAAFARFAHKEHGLRLWEWPDKRDHPRVSRKLVCYYLDDEGQMQLAMLTDLSVTGVGLITVRELPLQMETGFRFGVCDDLFIERRGRVVRSRKMDRGFDVGVQFHEQTPEERDELARAVSRAASE